MAGGDQQFTPFHPYIRQVVEQETISLRAELEQTSWEREAAEKTLNESAERLNQVQAAFMQAQQQIIQLQSQMPSGLVGTAPPPAATTVQNIIQRKADDKIAKLRLSKGGNLKKQDVWSFCEEVETAMRTGPVVVKSYMSSEVQDQVQFDFLKRYPTEGSWLNWTDTQVLERLQEVYPKHKETLYAADTIEEVARK